MFGEHINIGFIDENETEHDSITGYFDAKEDPNIKLISINPDSKTLDDIVSEIYSNRIDFLLVDLKLIAGSTKCMFNGDEIIKAINGANPYLPKIILTNDPGDSIELAIENAVIAKTKLDPEDITLYKSILTSVEKYREQAKAIDARIEELRIKHLTTGQSLTPKEENELLTLEDKIVQYIGKTKLSDSVLELIDTEKLERLLSQTETIINHFK